MESCALLPVISKILAILGLILDIYGVFKLFELEPKSLNEASKNIFESTLTEWTDSEKIKYTVSKLNENVENLRHQSNQLRRNSKKFKKIILIGFGFQIISIVLTFFYN